MVRAKKSAQVAGGETLENVEIKKKRTPNFIPSEKQLLLKLVRENVDILESKKTDLVSNSEKAAAWVDLCEKFNNLSGIHARTVEMLKNNWDNQKRTAKHEAAAEKLEIFKTGGGPRATVSAVSHENAQVLDILGPAGTGLINPLDGDALAGTSLESNVEIIIDPLLLSSKLDGPSWGNGSVCPKILYNPKPPELKMSSSSPTPSTPSSSSPPPSTSSSCSSQMPCSSQPLAEIKRQTIQGEIEWVKACKRRRPTIHSSVSENQEKLVAAKLALAIESKKQIEQEAARKEAQEAEEMKRKEELFNLEKKKKEMEAKILELQYKKLLREMGED